jgi:hypothetical protein
MKKSAVAAKDKEKINRFVSITKTSASEAKYWIDEAGSDLDTAVSLFFSNCPANSSPPSPKPTARNRRKKGDGTSSTSSDALRKNAAVDEWDEVDGDLIRKPLPVKRMKLLDDSSESSYQGLLICSV